MSSGDLSKLIEDEFVNQKVTIKKELAKVREEIRLLAESAKVRIESCEERITQVEYDILDIKRRFLKNNIIIFGLEIDSSDLVHSVITQLNSSLEINLQNSEINNIYTLGKNKSIIKVEFLSFLSKSEVTNNRYKLKGSRIFINDDLCKEDRNDLKLLRRHLNLAKADGHKAYIRKNYLVVDDEKFSIDQLKKREVANVPSSSKKILKRQPVHQIALLPLRDTNNCWVNTTIYKKWRIRESAKKSHPLNKCWKKPRIGRN